MGLGFQKIFRTLHGYCVIASTVTATALGTAGVTAARAQGQFPEDFLGEIVATATDFCRRGTMEADGRLLDINDNMELFSLFGTQYGGDGRLTFALPDLRGRSGGTPAFKHGDYSYWRWCVMTTGAFIFDGRRSNRSAGEVVPFGAFRCPEGWPIMTGQNIPHGQTIRWCKA